MHLLKVSTHPAHHNKTPTDQFGLVDSSAPWSPADFSPMDLVDWISSGKAWIACHITGKRNEEGTGSYNTVVFDVDGDYTLNEFWDNNLIQRHCLFTYTTPSHLQASAKNPDALERFRAVFLLDKTETERALHAEIYKICRTNFGLELKDDGGAKAERLWFGNSEAEFRFGQGTPIPWDWVAAAEDAMAESAKAAAARQASAPVGADDISRADWVLRNLLAPSAHGAAGRNYESYWMRVFQAAASAGDALYDAFMQWSSTGDHHAQELRRLQKTNRWQRSGNRSGIATLFAMAKEQHGDAWTSKLPAALAYPSLERPTALYQVARAIETVATQNLPPGPPPADDDEEGEPACVSFVPEEIKVKTVIPDAVAPRALYEVARSIQTLPPPSSHPSPNAAALTVSETERIFELLYNLTVHLVHRTPEADETVPESQAQLLIDKYRNELYAHRLYAANPARIDRWLFSRFRQEHGIEGRLKSCIAPRRLFARQDSAARWVIPGFLAAGRDYVLYAAQGMGKTTLSLMMARTASGYPGYETFLDSQPVPPEAWGKARILIIASDGRANAESDLQNYVRHHGMRDQSWVDDSLEVICMSPGTRAAPWRLDLFEVHRLVEALDKAAAEGRPYTFVIIDSLKATVPDGVMVGSQEITDWLYLMQDLAAQRNFALLYLHHQAKEGVAAQGAAGILELVSGVFRISFDSEAKRHIFHVVKTRVAGRKPFAEHPYRIIDGRLVDESADAGSNETPETVILQAFRRHYDEYRLKVLHLDDKASERNYPGVNPEDIILLLRQYTLHHSGLTSKAAAAKVIQQMLADGILLRYRITKRLGISSLPAFIDDTKQIAMPASDTEDDIDF